MLPANMKGDDILGEKNMELNTENNMLKIAVIFKVKGLGKLRGENQIKNDFGKKS